jgi:hypothetical protein
MKSFQYILIIALTGLTACNKQLDELQPHNITTEDKLFSTPEGYQRAVEGVYSLAFEAWGDDMLFTGEAQGNNLRQIDPSNDKYMDVFDFVHKYMDLWTPNYVLIQNINLIIEHASNSTDSIVRQAKAEALFCRAFAYFNLVRLYGFPYYQNPESNLGAILVTSSKDDGVKARNTVQQNYAQIINDLMQSIPAYTQNRGSSYASLYASEALLSRVYLYMGGTFSTPNKAFNDSVVKYASKVIDESPYILAQNADYVDIFSNQNTATTEDIFAINSQLSFSGLYRCYMTDGTTSAYYCPSPDLIQLIYAEEGDLRQQLIKKAEILMGEFSDSLETTKYYLNGDGSKAPLRHIRLIEMYLNRAEAYVKLGQDDKALLDLNVVRQRAGLQALPDNSLSGQDLFNAIFDQRRIEFAFEGQIAFDYFRNGLTMKRNYESTAAVGITNVREIQPTDPRTLQRIPAEELMKNKYLKQNEQ